MVNEERFLYCCQCLLHASAFGSWPNAMSDVPFSSVDPSSLLICRQAATCPSPRSSSPRPSGKGVQFLLAAAFRFLTCGFPRPREASQRLVHTRFGSLFFLRLPCVRRTRTRPGPARAPRVGGVHSAVREGPCPRCCLLESFSLFLVRAQFPSLPSFLLLLQFDARSRGHRLSRAQPISVLRERLWAFFCETFSYHLASNATTQESSYSLRKQRFLRSRTIFKFSCFGVCFSTLPPSPVPPG